VTIALIIPQLSGSEATACSAITNSYPIYQATNQRGLRLKGTPFAYLCIIDWGCYTMAAQLSSTGLPMHTMELLSTPCSGLHSEYYRPYYRGLHTLPNLSSVVHGYTSLMNIYACIIMRLGYCHCSH